MHHDDFLRGLAERPQDDSLRVVYADWLEEQGDPRGEYLRLELELLDLARPAPRYAEAENRLKTLRIDLDPKWVEAVGKRYDVILLDSPAEAMIFTVKVIRSVAGLSLKEAVDLVRSQPAPVKENLTRAEAEQMVLVMETFFAGDGFRMEVQLQPSKPAV